MKLPSRWPVVCFAGGILLFGKFVRRMNSGPPIVLPAATSRPISPEVVEKLTAAGVCAWLTDRDRATTAVPEGRTLTVSRSVCANR